MKNFKNQKGITLVALVVTIIVLLILAGVSLSLVAGSDGILGRATNAVDKNQIAMIKEKIELKVAEEVENFYEEKYVERTIDNSTTALEYISGTDTANNTTTEEKYSRVHFEEAGARYEIVYNTTEKKFYVIYEKTKTLLAGGGNVTDDKANASFSTNTITPEAAKDFNYAVELSGTVSDNGSLTWYSK